ncbi:hypothetical protein LTR32_003908 [Rachicladosporium monterosium]|uniref:FAD-binding FR-type domain-containing protein n=1 Tax=Rachicladosporium monterosium TaxID=1507873 RepID=A0ABR0L650_9PEZI|nr:hypothetical protein LTR32_003908 [Rachicladosporium monterosium]
MAYYQDMPWHDGEIKMQQLMKVPNLDNPTVPALSPQLANHLKVAPLIAIGTLDKQGRPWTTLWGGEKGLARSLGGGVAGIRTPVTGRYDPVVEELVGKTATGEVVKEAGEGRMVSGLTIDLETRKRTKLYGRMIAGALSGREDEITGSEETVAEIQLVLKIEQSLGNCPKYLNRKHIVPTFARPELISDGPHLPQRALDLIAKADLFFLSSSRPDQDMDTNHRGGPPGFLRVVSAGSESTSTPASIAWPEYSGNRFYQSIGNLLLNPLCGLCVPDFETGDMLHLTGTTRILTGADANAFLPRSNLALPFRGVAGESSPYNPSVRFLASEHRTALQAEGAQQQLQQATLLSQTKLTKTISRFRFHLENATAHRAGQYVTLDFSKSLDVGYSHMRDDDPRSLNDDFVRTFTVSSPPASTTTTTTGVGGLKGDEFEVTVRNVGVVTGLLFKHEGTAGRQGSELEIGVKGFGGEFEVKHTGDEDLVVFVAAGVGITPLLPALASIDLTRLELIWTVRAEDLGLVMDTVATYPKLAASLMLFVTGSSGEGRDEEIRRTGARFHTRRLRKDDLRNDDSISTYYVCTSVPMRKQVEQWLPRRALVFEDFNF